MNEFLATMDKINTIAFIISIIICIGVLVFVIVSGKYENKKKKIMINRNRVNRND